MQNIWDWFIIVIYVLKYYDYYYCFIFYICIKYGIIIVLLLLCIYENINGLTLFYYIYIRLLLFYYCFVYMKIYFLLLPCIYNMRLYLFSYCYVHLKIWNYKEDLSLHYIHADFIAIITIFHFIRYFLNWSTFRKFRTKLFNLCR